MNPLDNPAIDIVNGYLVEACQELLSQYGAESVHGESSGGKQSLCSLITANGEGIGIVSMIQPDTDLILRLHPANDTEISQEALEDWCGEFSNQLIGRVKTKLLSHDCEMAIGLPSLLAGEQINAVESKSAVTTVYWLKTDFGTLKLTGQVGLDPNFVLLDASAATGASDMLKEGEISLF